MIKSISFKSSESKSTKSEKNPSTLHSHPSSFEWAPSVQSDLFNYLKPAQRKAIRPFLQIIKRPYQEKLCISLMDYLEGNGLNPISQPVLRFLQQQIIEECCLHPLTSTAGSKIQDPSSRSSSEPKSIGALIKQLFPGLSHLKHETGEAL